MITVISGTNRADSKTYIVAKYCFDVLKKSNLDVRWLDLKEIQWQELTPEMYDAHNEKHVIKDNQEAEAIAADHWLVVCPEYNGSFPGILKLFIDAISVSNYKATFAGKKASLIGVSSGRAGNFRGLEHLTGILNYLGIHVMPNKLPLSKIHENVDSHGNLNKDMTDEIQMFIEQMVSFGTFADT